MKRSWLSLLLAVCLLLFLSSGTFASGEEQDNHLVVTVQETSYNVFPGDSVTLSVTASCDQGEIHYVWERLDYCNSRYGERVILQGETASTLTLSNIQTTETYYVTVTDDYGGQEIWWFDVTIPNGLSAERVGAHERYAAVGGSVTLSVRAQCAQGDIAYQWYVDGERIAGESGSSCTVVHAEDMTQSVDCVAIDAFGNRDVAYFRIQTAGDLSAWALDSEYVELEAGESVVLSVGTYSASGSSLTYQWVLDNGMDEEEEMPPVPGADGPTLLVDSQGGEGTYFCRVADTEGNTASVPFYVEVHSSLAVDWDYEMTAMLGESVTLSVDAWSGDGPVTYQWYVQNDGEIPVDGATSASYATGPLTSDDRYFICKVSDGYSTLSCQFEVLVINPDVSVTPVGSTNLQCQEGDEITLAVSVSGVTEEDELGYSWYKSGSYLGEHGESIQICAEAGTMLYNCEVYVNGYTYNVHFQVSTSPIPQVSLVQPFAVTFSEDAPVMLSFTPDSTGLFSFSVTDHSVHLGHIRFVVYDSSWNVVSINWESPFSQVLTGGETYYFALSGSDDFSWTRSASLLITSVSGSHSGSFTLIAGQRFEFPKREHGNIEVVQSTSDAPGVVRTLREAIAAVAPGTAHVDVTYDNGYQLHYTITVVPQSTQVLKVPRGTGAVQAAAFEGDRSIEYVRLGQCLYVGSRAFAGTGVKQVVFDISSGSNPYIAPDAFALSRPLIVGNGYMRDYAEQNGFEFLMIRHEEGGNG